MLRVQQKWKCILLESGASSEIGESTHTSHCRYPIPEVEFAKVLQVFCIWTETLVVRTESALDVVKRGVKVKLLDLAHCLPALIGR